MNRQHGVYWKFLANDNEFGVIVNLAKQEKIKKAEAIRTIIRQWATEHGAWPQSLTTEDNHEA